ncbi:WXG100 family type VII secretion target [Nocardia sp. NPDC127526]|uniref:WXG100 family type VII secretion target n=1 Tax=Nocardia sp. NPDC127526 TaxID=3345393 RepID=UPI00363EA4D2
MLYDAKTMNELASSLKENFGQLMIAGQDLEAAANKLTTAWEGNQAQTSFVAVHKKWNDEYSNTLQTLDNVAAEVENALGRALGADGKIGDGFVF